MSNVDGLLESGSRLDANSSLYARKDSGKKKKKKKKKGEGNGI